MTTAKVNEENSSGETKQSLRPTHRAQTGEEMNEAARRLAQRQPWYVVQNGNQIDVHARVFPANQESREIDVYYDISLEDATQIVNQHNAAHFERLRDLENQARDAALYDEPHDFL